MLGTYLLCVDPVWQGHNSAAFCKVTQTPKVTAWQPSEAQVWRVVFTFLGVLTFVPLSFFPLALFIREWAAHCGTTELVKSLKEGRMNGGSRRILITFPRILDVTWWPTDTLKEEEKYPSQSLFGSLPHLEPIPALRLLLAHAKPQMSLVPGSSSATRLLFQETGGRLNVVPFLKVWCPHRGLDTKGTCHRLEAHGGND